MKILITGVSGMLGQELYQYFKDSHEVLGLDLNNKFENKN
jgi:nucleoside-diphosphate-sugar epimerase